MKRTLASRLNTLASCMLLGLVVVSAQSWYALQTNESLRAGLLSIAIGVAVAAFVRRPKPSQRGASRLEKAETSDSLTGQTVRLRSLIGTPQRSQAFPAAARVRRVAAPAHLHA